MLLYFVLLFSISIQIISSAITQPQSPLPFFTSSSVNSSPSPSPIGHQRRKTWTSTFTHRFSFPKGQISGELLNKLPEESTSSSIQSPFSPWTPRHSLPLPPSPLYHSGGRSGELGISTLHEHTPAVVPISLANNETNRGSSKCNCKYLKRLGMKDFIFQSDITKEELRVKVAINNGNFASGKWAKLFNGCFKINNDWECVGVKLVGRGTIQNPTKAEEKMTDEQILYDPKKEVNNLWRIKKKTFRNPDQRKHIIELYDGGKIFYSNKKDRKKYEHVFQYAVILELGENNYLEEFINQSKTLKIKTEKEIMQFLATGAEPFIEIHKILIHMDLKPQNMVYVKKGKNRILKVIDFVGAQFFEKNQSNDPSSSKSGKSHHREGIQMINKKMASTFYLMPPEIDGIYQYYLHHKDNEENEDIIDNEDIVKANFNPIATTKSDMWEFGILIYNLLLVHEYPEKSQKEISNYLDAINKIYQYGNEAENFDDIQRFIENVFPSIKKDAIFGYAQILKIRSKYPRLFLLVTNLLDKNPRKRLTAKGVFDYLNGECKIVGKEEEWYAMKGKFIGQITIEMVNESNLEEMAMKSKQELKFEFSNDNMEKMLKEDWNELKKITKICDRRGELIPPSDSPKQKLILPDFPEPKLSPPDSPEQILSSDNDGNDNEASRQEMHKFKMEHWWEVSNHEVTAVDLKQRQSQGIILPKK